ncbi:MAG: PDZ domain-containing protein [Chloroflexi bacterium]|nr:PDZ domain-containing protein [Chloroflexota bacterium]
MPVRRLSLVALLLLTLSCNTLTRAFTPVEPTLAPPPAVTDAPTIPVITETPLTPIDIEGAPPILYTPPGCQNVPPATVPPATTVAEPTATPLVAGNPEISTDEQKRIFEKLVGTIERVYVYPDYNGKDWPGIVNNYRAKVEAGLNTETFYIEMNAMIADLGDEHSHFESPAEVAASNADLSGALDYVGIGILVQSLPEKGRVTVLAVFPNSSAERGGLKAHDSILAVDGSPIAQDGEAHPQWVRGPECSAVVLSVESPGQSPRDLAFIRYRITDPQPIDAKLVNTTDGSRIGYIFLPTFFDETIPGQVEQALQDFGDLDGLILDNRMNGGGSSLVVEPILSYFTSGKLGEFASRNDSRSFNVASNPIHNSQTVPLVVLVGEDTVSFGEIFSGILRDIGRAKIVGQTTLGNVETMYGYDFEDGSRAWIAQERFDPPVSHEFWEQTGIVPDVEAFADWDTFTFENDPAVTAAVELLGHK